MSSFKALSWGSLKKFTPLIIEKDSFALVLKPSKVSDSFCVKFTQLEKPFKYLRKFSCNYLQALILNCNLPLLKFFLASVAR